MNKKTLALYEFDRFRLDANQKCLWHGDELVSLTPKAFETLLVLIKNRGKIVEKDVLLDEVWADTFVEESTLSQNILTLRKTLRAFQKDKQFIVTVPRRGYRFIGEVKEIIDDEEVFVVEKHTRTHIIAEQQEIHDSAESRETDIAKPVSPHLLPRKYLTFGLILSGLVILAGGILAFRYLGKTTSFAETKFQKFRISSLFSDADIQRAVISPNGKYLALVEKKGETESLLLRQIEEANSLAVVPKFNGQFIGVTFSPESDYLFYAVYPKTDASARQGELYKIPILGGAPQQIIKNIDSPVSVSADRKKIVFVRRHRQEKETALIIADAGGTNERKLAVRKFGEGFLNAAFSPDGKFISCVANSKESLERPMEIVIVNAENGEQKTLTTQNWLWIGQSVWLKDGSGIAVVGYSAKSPNLTDEVWFVSFPEGKARLLETGVNGVFGISLTDDSNSLVTVKSSKITSFAVSPLEDLANSTTLLTKTGDESLLPLGVDWTTDEKIVYSTTNNGSADLWTINADGAGRKQITSDASADFSPKVSRAGSFIYFLSNRSGLMSVWRINSDGTDPQQISRGSDVFSINLSPDDKWIYYTARSDSIFTQTLWKAAPDGKDARQLTDKTVLLPKISPDGKMIACYYPDLENQNLKLTVLSAENGEVLRQIETPKSDGLSFHLEWKKDSRNLLFTVRRNGVTSLWLQSIDGAPAKHLKDWQNESIFRLAVSKDGEKIFYEKGVTANSVMLLRDISAEN